jgi:hypothetical protein
MDIHPNESVSHNEPRASVIADFLRAQKALPSDPDLASLYLDGALRGLLALIASPLSEHQFSHAQALHALDHQRPHFARRLRLALRAPHVEARLAHCWALIDLLNADKAQSGSPHES